MDGHVESPVRVIHALNHETHRITTSFQFEALWNAAFIVPNLHSSWMKTLLMDASH